ncbi:MAG: hypothetical protein DLM63_02460 [Solirubrobacterales bacterium]|nr:MAG: hypothetical protein DLM63_02460 [Solirubrobacterales bacterium]
MIVACWTSLPSAVWSRHWPESTRQTWMTAWVIGATWPLGLVQVRLRLGAGEYADPGESSVTLSGAVGGFESTR